MRALLCAAVGVLLLAVPAGAQTVDNASLANVGLANGPAGLSSSASLSASRISASTNVTTQFGAGVNQNPAGNNGLGGTANGFAETTVLRGGGEAINNTSLSGSGTLVGSVQLVNQSGGLNGNPNGSLANTALGAAGRIDGSFQRTANSNAATGLNGYSGIQLTGPGTLSQTVNGSALAVGTSLGGSAGLR